MTRVCFIRSIRKKIQIIMSGPLFCDLLGCVLFIAFSLFALDKSLDEINYNTIICIECLTTSILTTFILCSLSEQMTSQSYRMADTLFESKWYGLPVTEQKWLILLIQRSGKEFRLNGYKIIDCSLKTFVAVCLDIFFLQIFTNYLNIFFS